MTNILSNLLALSSATTFMCSDMQDGWTGLIHAAVSGKSGVVTELISLGADVDIQTNVSHFLCLIMSVPNGPPECCY